MPVWLFVYNTQTNWTKNDYSDEWRMNGGILVKMDKNLRYIINLISAV